ncbi:hypothetical protein [Fodinibius saliphilus]|uniref:hypothetical protein n=1 Tax=Fodinibius saliphilus TaxID=1920650 RepID=UPI001108DB69|nr:hypothetical protein [Fodinibius saliphilus]
MDRISEAENRFSIKQRFKSTGIAGLISDLFNPLFLPLLVLIVLAIQLQLPYLSVGWITGVSLIFYTVIPLCTSFYLLKTNTISSLDLPERESRSRLFLISLASSAIAFLLFFYSKQHTHTIIPLVALTFLINAAIAFVVNLYWKISIHSASLSSTAAIFFFISQYQILSSFYAALILSLFILLLLLPIMIWARYHLKIHTWTELLGGAVTGFLLTIIDLTILTTIW